MSIMFQTDSKRHNLLCTDLQKYCRAVKLSSKIAHYKTKGTIHSIISPKDAKSKSNNWSPRNKWATSWESLISVFVVRCLDSIIPLVSISEFSSLYIVFVTAQTGLCITWSQTPKTGFLVTGPKCDNKWNKKKNNKGDVHEEPQKHKWASPLENLFLPYANNKGADSRSLVSTFAVRWLDSIISLVSKFLASFCVCADRFESYLVENPEDRVVRDEAQFNDSLLMAP